MSPWCEVVSLPRTHNQTQDPLDHKEYKTARLQGEQSRHGVCEDECGQLVVAREMDVRVVMSDEVGHIEFRAETLDVPDTEHHDADEHNAQI